MALTKLKRKPSDPSDTIRMKDSSNVEWLTRIELREATPLGKDGPDTTNLIVYVMDSSGSDPVSHSRALTDAELADPAFDPETVVAKLTTELVAQKTQIKNSQDKLQAFKNKVRDDGDINLNKENK